jgi:seryl-tRNA synthetase
MAKTKKTKGKSKAKRAPVGKRTAARKKVRASAPAASRRVIELEAENRRLREEIAALRAERDERGGEIASDGPPTLEL